MDAKTQLIHIATDLFATHGYDAVGVKEIVDQAGVTKPTLYHHFGNKEGLLKAVLEQLNEFLLTQRQTSAYQGDLYMSLKRTLLGYIGFAQSHEALFRLFRFMSQMPQSTVSAQAVHPYLRKSLAIQEAMFSAASLDHGNMQGKATLFATNFISTSLTYATLVVEGHVQMTDDLIHQVVHAFSYGIYS